MDLRKASAIETVSIVDQLTLLTDKSEEREVQRLSFVISSDQGSLSRSLQAHSILSPRVHTLTWDTLSHL